MIYSLKVVPAIVATLIVAVTRPQAPAQDTQRQLCDIRLSSAVGKVLDGVEHEYGKPVVCRLDVLRGEAAKFDLSTGIPVVTLDKTDGKSEGEILHELLHLQIRADLVTVVFLPPLPPPDVSKATLDKVMWDLTELMDHSLMYPQMRSMGFDPDKYDRTGIERGLSMPKGHPPWGKYPPQIRAMAFANLTLVSNRALVKRLEDSIDRAGWHDSVVLGEKIEELVRSGEVGTRDGRARTSILCLNLLFGNKFEMRWEYKEFVLSLGTGPIH